MLSSIPGISQLMSRCNLRQQARSIRPRLELSLMAAVILLLVSSASSLAQLKQVPGISTIAGNGTGNYSGDGGPATSTGINGASGVAVDNAGNVYFADFGNSVVRRVDASTGNITTVAGNQSYGYSGDGGAATSAQLSHPAAIGLDSSGNLYIADANNNRVRKVTTAGVITTIAGNGTGGYSGDGGPATSAALQNPQGVTLDGAGNLYIADSDNNVVREVQASNGNITTVAGSGGTGSFAGDGGLATSAKLNSPSGLVLDGAGDLYIADTQNSRIRMVSAATGKISTVAGNGTSGYSGDGGAATSAELQNPSYVLLDGGGNLYISDTLNNRIRMVSAATGTITTVAGNGQKVYGGDYGAATSASFNGTFGIGFDSTGNLYVAEFNYIRKVGLLIFPPTSVSEENGPFALILQTTATETISSLTVPPSQNNKTEYSVHAVTGCATDGATVIPAGTNCEVEVIFDPAYPGLRSVPLQVVTSTGKVNIGLIGTGVAPLAAMTPGTMSTLAGEINPPNCNAYSGPALNGPLCNPSAGAVDFAGNVYIPAFYSNTVSKLDTSGNITVIAGTGAGGVGGIGGPATSANIERPADVAVDAAGNVFFADESAQQVFKIDAITQILTSVAGNGTEGYSGDNGPATQASLNRPEGVALDTAGNLYIEDQDNNLIRKVNTFGIITTVAGDPTTIGQGSPAYSGDGGLAIKAPLALCCSGVYASYDSIGVDAAGNLYIGDSGHHVVRKVTTDGIIHTIAGNNALGAGFSGDGGAATSAQLNWPMGVTTDPAGDVYIADFANNRIRKVEAATQIISTVAGDGTQGSASGGLATQVDLNGPQKVELDGEGNLYVSDTKNNLVRETNVSNPTLTFATSTAVGSVDTTDGPLGVSVSDIGNAPLLVQPPPSSGTDPSISTGFTLYTGETGACFTLSTSSSAMPLQQGSSCGLEANFAPLTSGNITGSLVLTDNSLNTTNPYSTQTVTLDGVATGSASPQPVLTPTSMDFGNVPIQTVSSAQTAILQNNGTTALAVGFGVIGHNPGGFGYSDNCGISVAAGASCSIVINCAPVIVETLTATFVADFLASSTQQTISLTCNGTSAAGSLTIAPTAQMFPSTPVGSTSPTLTSTITNATNETIYLSAGSLTDAADFTFTTSCGGIIASNTGTCTVTFAFTPQSTGALTSTYSIHDLDHPNSPLTVVLSGNGSSVAAPQATLTPSTEDFGSVTTGTTSSSQTFTLSNTGTAPLGITSIALGGANAGSFSISTDNCTTGAVATARPASAAHGHASPRDIPALPTGSSCQIIIVFSPTSAGSSTATLTVVDDAGTQTSTLTGTAIAPAAPVAALTPASVNFGNVTNGTPSAAQTFTLTNGGNAPLTISGITLAGANASDFAETTACGSTLAAGASCTIAVTFTPSATGSFTGSLSVADNASGSPQTSSLTGAGTVPPDFTIVATPAAQNVSRGGVAAYSVSVSSTNGSFTDAVVLTAAGLPGGTITFSPASVTPGSSAAQSTMTVQTTTQQAAGKKGMTQWPFAAPVFAALLLLWPGKRWRSRRILMNLACIVALLGIAASSIGCGGGFALPAKTYTITVTGTSGSDAHSTTVTLTVQ